MISRRQFLRGDLAGRKALLRPPWALAEDAFLAACTRCGDCIGVCPTNILVLVRGYPEVDFARGECTFCGKCHDACRPHALLRQEGKPPWRLKARIAGNCLAYREIVCRSCGDACGAAAIRFSPRVMGAAHPELIADRCTGCGACVSACPAGAVTMAAAGG
ncbi:MAG: ferredoxin-type protein NapF [Pseudomonadota bacterium]